SGIQRDLALAAIALADSGAEAQAPQLPPTLPSVPLVDGKKPEKPGDKKDPASPTPRRPQPKDELPEAFLGQAIKSIVMHEVGHSLGLRHNSKASTMLNAEQLHDTAVTRTKGLVGSVMDYCPINIAPKGQKQGDYYPTTLGPYDYWAIEYAYKPVDG